MAFIKKQPQTATSLEFIDLTQFTVQNVKILTERCISFTLRGHGFSLYNVKLIQTADKKTGEEKLMFSPSQHRGSDGKWYADYGLYIAPEDTMRLTEIVLREAGCILGTETDTTVPPVPTFSESDGDFVTCEGTDLPFPT